MEDTVNQRAHVVRMFLLHEKYRTYMQSNFPEYYNENYKVDKWKRKLISFFDSRLRFWQRYEGTSDLVYLDVLTGQAVGVAFKNVTTDEQSIIEAAMILWRVVMKVSKKVIKCHGHQPIKIWIPTILAIHICYHIS